MIKLHTIRVGHEWTHFVLDEGAGLFAAHGSYGSFAYCWPPAYRSEPLEEFLARIHLGYFASKVRRNSGKEFDFDATVTRMKEVIAEERRCENISKSVARDAWNELDEADPASDSNFFATQIDLTRDVLGSDWHEFFRYDYSPELKGFWEVIWPAFLIVIKHADVDTLFDRRV